jgi:putative DNA primase/helicase
MTDIPADLTPLGIVLGQDNDAVMVATIEELWQAGKIPGPVFGRRGTNHLHEEVSNYHRLEILWAAAAPAGDYYSGEYDSEAYAHPRLSGLSPPGADYLRNLWKDIAVGADTLDRVRALLSLAPVPVDEAPIYHTGLPGKPTSWSLIEGECRRRYYAGERYVLKGDAESPSEWARVNAAKGSSGRDRHSLYLRRETGSLSRKRHSKVYCGLIGAPLDQRGLRPMRAADIAAALGHGRQSGGWWRCVCPVHRSRTGSSLTLALRDGHRGLVIKCFAGCDTRDVLAELRRRGLIAGTSNDARPAPIPIRSDDSANAARRIELARRVWDAARDAPGSPVARYLAGRRITASLPASLRWARSLRRPDGISGPAMLARIDNIDGELIGVHRTWLARDPAGDWCRRDRAMLGRAAGGAVHLAAADEMLMIGEGIKTCLTAMQATALPATALPAWAALSTSGMVELRLPPIVRTVIILADHDLSGAGERAARTAAARWLAEGRRVRLAMPPQPGIDFNDVLLGRSFARIEDARDAAP